MLFHFEEFANTKDGRDNVVCAYEKNNDMGIVQESWKLDAVDFNYKYPSTFHPKSTSLLIINTTIFTFTLKHYSLFHIFTFSF